MRIRNVTNWSAVTRSADATAFHANVVTLRNEALRIFTFKLFVPSLMKKRYTLSFYDANSLNYSSCTYVDATSLNMFIKFHLNNKVTRSL